MPYVCQDRARALVKAGHEVHVITTGRKAAEGEQLDDKGVQVQHMPCKSAENSDEFARHCSKYCKSLSPSIVHLDSLDVLRPWWKDLPKTIVTACTLHGFCWGDYFTKWNLWQRSAASLDTAPAIDQRGIAKERKLFASFNRIIGISRHEHWMLADLMNLFDAKLVYNPIADCFFETPRTIPPQSHTRRILCAAVSGHKERGFDIAERAANGVAELVFAKDVPREQMPQLIDNCHALVLPTAYSQGLDLAVGEAIVRRRPVIVTATGSYRREAELGGIYESSPAGPLFLVPLTDTDALAQAMARPLEPIDWRGAKPWLHGSAVHAKKWLEAILG